MKKLILFFLCTATFAGVQAQAKFGLKAGVNVATLTGDDVEDVKAKLGFNVGGFAELPLADAFSLRPEVVFSGQGAKADGEGDYKLNLGYLNVPVLAKWSSEGGFFAETGPQVGFLLSAKAKAGDLDMDMKDYYKSIDFAWAFGIGYQVASNIGINGRYNLGLANVADSDDGSVKNSVFQVGAFYTFGSK